MQTFRLRPSLILAAILVIAHVAAATAVSFVHVPLWLALITVSGLFWNCWVSVRRAALLRASHSVVAIEISFDNVLSVITRDGARTACEVLGSTYVSSVLSVLNLRVDGARKLLHVTVLPDSMESDDFRKLRVWLRWQRSDA